MSSSMFLSDIVICCFFYGYGDHRDLHVLTHSFPTRRSSDRPRAPAPASARRHNRARGSPASTPQSACAHARPRRSEEHTSELQSLMRISYAVFCLKKKTTTKNKTRRNDKLNMNTTVDRIIKHQ